MDDTKKDGDSMVKECGCGGMCGMWKNASKEDKTAFLEKKEAKLEKMLAHVKKVKESVASGKEMEMGSEK